MLYHSLAPALLASGDLAGYRRLRTQILAQFAGSQDPFIGDRMGKDC
jgi:hypothetical protein